MQGVWVFWDSFLLLLSTKYIRQILFDMQGVWVSFLAREMEIFNQYF